MTNENEVDHWSHDGLSAPIVPEVQKTDLEKTPYMQESNKLSIEHLRDGLPQPTTRK